MPRRLLLCLALAFTPGCAALASALAVAQPVVGAVCVADGFAPIAASPHAWTSPEVVDALNSLAEVDRLSCAGAAPSAIAAARATYAARLPAIADAGAE